MSNQPVRKATLNRRRFIQLGAGMLAMPALSGLDVGRTEAATRARAASNHPAPDPNAILQFGEMQGQDYDPIHLATVEFFQLYAIFDTLVSYTLDGTSHPATRYRLGGEPRSSAPVSPKGRDVPGWDDDGCGGRPIQPQPRTERPGLGDQVGGSHVGECRRGRQRHRRPDVVEPGPAGAVVPAREPGGHDRLPDRRREGRKQCGVQRGASRRRALRHRRSVVSDRENVGSCVAGLLGQIGPDAGRDRLRQCSRDGTGQRAASRCHGRVLRPHWVRRTGSQGIPVHQDRHRRGQLYLRAQPERHDPASRRRQGEAVHRPRRQPPRGQPSLGRWPGHAGLPVCDGELPGLRPGSQLVVPIRPSQGQGLVEGGGARQRHLFSVGNR